MLEQIVEDSVSGRYHNVSFLELNVIIICILWRVLAHIIFLFENLLQLGHFGQLALSAEDFEICLRRQLRELVRNIKSVLLLL